LQGYQWSDQADATIRQRYDVFIGDLITFRNFAVDSAAPVHASEAMKYLRVLAWILIAGLVILTIVPASERPVTGVEHNYEHFLAFGLTGLVYALAYPKRLVILLTQGVVFALALELLQIPLPSRHARLGDFAVDALAGCGGMVVAYLSKRVWDTKLA
jgi:hypothetical protein